MRVIELDQLRSWDESSKNKTTKWEKQKKNHFYLTELLKETMVEISLSWSFSYSLLTFHWRKENNDLASNSDSSLLVFLSNLGWFTLIPILWLTIAFFYCLTLCFTRSNVFCIFENSSFSFLMVFLHFIYCIFATSF